MRQIKKRLGDILVDEGVISQAELIQALDYGKQKGLKLGQALKELGMADETAVTKALSNQLRIPLINLEKIVLDPALGQVVPEMLARKHLLVPVGKKEGKILVAMADPLNIYAFDEVSRSAKAKVEACIAPESQIRSALERLYAKEAAAPSATEETEENEAVSIINETILEGVKSGASDIHIEPMETHLRIRHRVDGVLQSVKQLSLDLHPSMVSRLKVMSGLDIGEKRRPQDGRFQMSVTGREIDFRVSTLPTSKGEKVVLRLLDKASIRHSLGELGLEEDQRYLLEKNLKNPHGMILVTGPTGSGKTTTLYACLNIINSVDKNIVTVEDPVEYELEGINQVQVNPKADLTFANALRSILRQDPDIVMIGEIRDSETSEIAIQAALTGHLVLSTLHTNTSAGAITRLLDMEIQPFLIASSLYLVVAQRLLRRLCPACKRPFVPEKELIEQWGLEGPLELFSPVGCQECNNTGYRGRLAIFEMLEITPAIEVLIMRKAGASDILGQAKGQGTKTLRESGLDKAVAGITSLDEVFRVTMDAKE